jgi:hypothetical protein
MLGRYFGGSEKWIVITAPGRDSVKLWKSAMLVHIGRKYCFNHNTLSKENNGVEALEKVGNTPPFIRFEETGRFRSGEAVPGLRLPRDYWNYDDPTVDALVGSLSQLESKEVLTLLKELQTALQDPSTRDDTAGRGAHHDTKPTAFVAERPSVARAPSPTTLGDADLSLAPVRGAAPSTRGDTQISNAHGYAKPPPLVAERPPVIRLPPPATRKVDALSLESARLPAPQVPLMVSVHDRAAVPSAAHSRELTPIEELTLTEELIFSPALPLPRVSRREFPSKVWRAGSLLFAIAIVAGMPWSLPVWPDGPRSAKPNGSEQAVAKVESHVSLPVEVTARTVGNPETSSPTIPEPPRNQDAARGDEEIELWIQRGDRFLMARDIVSARSYYKRAAAAGSKSAAFALARTYEAKFLAEIGAKNVRPDAEKAAAWYRVAGSASTP